MEQMIVPILPVLCIIFGVLAVLYLVLDGKQSRQTVPKAAKPRPPRPSAPERPVKKRRQEQSKPRKPAAAAPKPEPVEASAAVSRSEPEKPTISVPKTEPERISAAAPKPKLKKPAAAASKPKPEKPPKAVPKPEPEKAAAVVQKPEPEKPPKAVPRPKPKKIPKVMPDSEPENPSISAPRQVFPEMSDETQAEDLGQTEGKRIFRILTHDPAFAADDFKAYAVSCFQRLRAARRLEDIPAIRGFVGETFYLRKRSVTAMSFLSDDAPVPPEEPVLSCVITDDIIEDGKESLTVMLETGENGESVKRYRMIFAREEGTRTLSVIPLSAFRCPSCGKSLSVDIVGICNACGVCVADGSQYWLVEQLESIE